MEKEFLGHLSGLKSIAVNSKDGILATGAKVFYLFRMGQVDYGIKIISNLKIVWMVIKIMFVVLLFAQVKNWLQREHGIKKLCYLNIEN